MKPSSWPLATSSTLPKKNISALRTGCTKAIKQHNNNNKDFLEATGHNDHYMINMDSQRSKTDPYLQHCPKYKIFEKKIFYSKNHGKFQEFSENVTFSESPMLPQQTKESAADTMHPWRIQLRVQQGKNSINEFTFD